MRLQCSHFINFICIELTVHCSAQSACHMFLTQRTIYLRRPQYIVMNTWFILLFSVTSWSSACVSSQFMPIDSMMKPHGAKVLTTAPYILLTHNLWPITKGGVSLNRDFVVLWRLCSTKSLLALLTRALKRTMKGQTGTTLPVTGWVYWKITTWMVIFSRWNFQLWHTIRFSISIIRSVIVLIVVIIVFIDYIYSRPIY